MRLNKRTGALMALLALGCCCGQVSSILVQPHNYMLDDSGLLGMEHHDSGSLSPFYNDQAGSSEHSADKDIISIIGDGLARIRYARMLEQQPAEHEAGEGSEANQAPQNGQLSPEMAELVRETENADQAHQEGSLSSSVAGLLMNVAQAAAQATSGADAGSGGQSGAQESEQARETEARQSMGMSARGNIMELDTTGSGSSSQASKADLKNVQQNSQWFNPKETIPVLKISSMATPSKYKKVYFRSEKKLVDGAFHSLPGSEQKEKKSSSLIKAFNSGKGVQRRSSRAGTSSSAAPPGILQDGVIDFLKKFRDVYVQTRPSQQSNLAQSVVSAAASSPLAALVAAPSGSGRPNLAGAISVATSMMGAASSGAQQAAPAAAAGSASPIKSPLSAQSYVSFWSKTFPTWVRKMLKQMRRRSLYNSSKRNQQHQQNSHQHATSLAQAAASSVIEHATNAATSGGAASSSSGSSSSSSSSSSA